ncbi:hypothetical protein A8F71_04030 [Burkholderia cenocepacia]|nr:hypothetical protein A8F71_04030 [Burkholderia cenocepacia]
MFHRDLLCLVDATCPSPVVLQRTQPPRAFDQRRVVLRKTEPDHAGVGAVGIERRQRNRRDARVATIPLSAFYTDGTDAGVIRLSFSKDDATLVEGARRLRSL